MNSTSDTNGVFGSDNMGGFGYGIGVSAGLLFLVTTTTLASYFCTRKCRSSQNQMNAHDQLDTHHMEVDVGLDDATIRSYPKVQYSEAKLQKIDSATCCSVCLADYKTSDTLRQLPDCGHLFHPNCIHPWLRVNPTCPVCRTSPLSTPLVNAVVDR